MARRGMARQGEDHGVARQGKIKLKVMEVTK